MATTASGCWAWTRPRAGSSANATAEFIDFEHPAIAGAILAHIVEHADVVGTDRRGRTVMRFEFAAPPWLIDKLAAFGARQADLEPDDDFEMEDAA